MPGYGANRATHRIELKAFDGSKNWVDIKAGRSSGASTRVNFAGMKITGLTEDGRPIVAVRDQPRTSAVGRAGAALALHPSRRAGTGRSRRTGSPRLDFGHE
jgi:hypothetical protein